MKKIIFIIGCLIVGFSIYKKNDEIIIPNDAIRVRIIANSNNVEDIRDKIRIKDEIKKDLYHIVSDADNSANARKSIISNINKIKKIVSLKTDNFTINYGKNYFPKKVYRGIIYNEGMYDSLTITLGKGLGENWWCVLYPPLCLIKENNITSDVEYRSFVYDLLKN